MVGIDPYDHQTFHLTKEPYKITLNTCTTPLSLSSPPLPTHPSPYTTHNLDQYLTKNVPRHFWSMMVFFYQHR